jgi:hypothetical protein
MTQSVNDRVHVSLTSLDGGLAIRIEKGEVTDCLLVDTSSEGSRLRFGTLELVGRVAWTRSARGRPTEIRGHDVFSFTDGIVDILGDSERSVESMRVRYDDHGVEILSGSGEPMRVELRGRGMGAH